LRKGGCLYPQLIWNIEQHWNDKCKFTFILFSKNYLLGKKVCTGWFHYGIDLRIAMWTSLGASTPDPEKEGDGLTSAHW
jgi:hypothetical protein